MMKIGIITRHNALNSGAILQAYALQTYLLKLGHHVEFIDYQIPRNLTIRSFISKNIKDTLQKWKDIFWNSYFSKDQRFNKGMLKIGNRSYYSLNDLKNTPPDYDVYIAGSDQIWNITSNYKIFEPYFLNFGSSKTKRISFAASFGQCLIPEELNQTIRRHLLKFDAISVRERSGVKYAKSLVGQHKEVKLIADPTFLLSAKEYLNIMSVRPDGRKKSFMVSYILSNYSKEQQQVIQFLKSIYGNLINLRNPASCISLSNAENIIVRPHEWLMYINSSEFVICSSFHAVVFSLIFHKPFIALTPTKNERIINLLTTMNLMDRYVTKFDEKEMNTLIKSEINWSGIDDLIRQERERSFKYIKESLK